LSGREDLKPFSKGQSPRVKKPTGRKGFATKTLGWEKGFGNRGERGTCLLGNPRFLPTNSNIEKIKKRLPLKGIISFSGEGEKEREKKGDALG